MAAIGYPLSAMQLPAHTDISASLPDFEIPAFRHIKDRLNQVRGLINTQLTSRIVDLAGRNWPGQKPTVADMDQLFEYVRGRSGKMIRPGLVLLAGSCCGNVTDKHIRVAAIIEMIHNATLLHDDVIDQGQRRRGRPTVNSIWGNEYAVIMGDFLLSRVFKLCAEIEPEMTKVIADAAVRLCEGELRQIIQTRNWQLSESEYIDVITEKSAVLFSVCCSIGAVLAGAQEWQVRSLSEFGLNAGIAFQITDDLLDISGDEKVTGKNSGNDINQCKLTLAVIHLLKTVDKTEKDMVINSFLKGEKTGQHDSHFVELLKRCGSLEYARSKAGDFVEKAIRALDGLEDNDAKEALIETAKFMAYRAV
jgi:octaprenyl-diphosphate synthase